MLNLLSRIFGESNQGAVSKLQPLVDEINQLEEEVRGLSDDDLKALTPEFRERLQEGETLDDLLPEAFAAVREAARRRLGQRHFDVQLLGGMVLHQGRIAEMRTGEGKTLVATLPAYLNALTGEGVHVVTVNDYLARRDASWMGAVYDALGMKVGCLQNQASWLYDPEAASAPRATDGSNGAEPHAGEPADPMRAATKREAYAADITYGTNNEFGFDYLRDNMVDDASRMVQRELKYAIVDEVDNILIDEARTPLIISGPAPETGQEYRRFSQVARRLIREEDFTVDEKLRTISLTEEGMTKLEKLLNVDNLYDPSHFALTHFIENAVRAEALYMRDREYVVQNGEVILVDEFTGRLMHGRRYSDGLHQALEAKEGVNVQRESVTYATITLQNYFRMYQKLAGMTGTAATEAEELAKIYKLEVVQIPTNRPMIRDDMPDLIFKSEPGKYAAAANIIQELHRAGRPVLVGTTSIEKSEVLSDLLNRRNIPHDVLNAKQHDREAVIVAQAGRPGAVTVATNMAGRGTDIILGGNPELLEISREQWQKDHDRVVEQGGLFILGTERHEARRIDNQLRGRAGRQGDPGASQFYVSTEDDLMRRFGGDRIRGIMNFAGIDDETPIENRMVSRAVEGAQSKVEAVHFELRKHLVDYDDVINTHRDVIYRLRQKALRGDDLRSTILSMVRDALESIVVSRLVGDSENWEIEAFQQEVNAIFPLPQELDREDDVASMDRQEIADLLLQHAERLYEERTEQFGPEMMVALERAVVLRTIDTQWVEHLTSMENMRQGIGLEAAGQRDPLVQYKRVAYDMFGSLMARIDHDIAHTIYRVALAQPQPQRRTAPMTAGRPEPSAAGGNGSAPRGAAAARAAQVAGGRSVMSAVAAGHGSDVATGQKKVGRNEPCPCGSGKKFKRCHGAG